MLGNTKLIQYGILNEESDIRAHVCPLAKKVYVYPTQSGVYTVQSGSYKVVPAFQNGIKTAEGYLVPPLHIPRIQVVEPPANYWNVVGFRDFDSLGSKGEKAVRLVKGLLINGLFPLWTQGQVITEKSLQISGTDILVSSSFKIQVKCDYKGGEGRNTTGNLYLQISECNPFCIY